MFRSSMNSLVVSVSFILFSELASSENLKLEISPLIHHDFNLDKHNNKIPVPLSDEAVANYAWNTFFALNFPSHPIDSGKRGIADPGRSFGSAGPTVWSTFKQKRELFRISADHYSPTGYIYSRNDPGPYDALIDFDKMSPNIEPCFGQKPSTPTSVWHFLDESQEIGLATIWSKGPEPTDTNLVRTQVKMNRSYYDYIRSNRFYDSDTLNYIISKFTDPVANPFGPVDLPAGNEENEGAILIKTSWLKTRAVPEVYRHQFYTVEAMYYEDAPTKDNVCYRIDEFSLIAIHVIHKTRSFPQFLYTTFENINNPNLDLVYANSIGKASTLPNAYGYKYKNPENPKPGLQYPPYPVHFDINKPRQVVDEVNEKARRLIADKFPRAVWQYYKLVGLQFAPANSEFDPINKLQDYYLANPVVETNQRFQRFTGTFGLSSSNNVAPQPYKYVNKVQMGGCMGCHGAGAQGGPYTPEQIVIGFGGTDFSFLLFAVRSNPRDHGVETLLKPAIEQIIFNNEFSLPPWLQEFNVTRK